MKYAVEYIETIQKVIIVEADNENEAIEKVDEAVAEGNLTAEVEDFFDYNISCYEPNENELKYCRNLDEYI